MITIALIGSGNVAYHLANAFINDKNITLKQVYARRLASLDFLPDSILKTDQLETLVEADIYVIAIKDDAIASVSKQLKNTKSLVVHTSGSVAKTAVENHLNNGVLYPLQTFTKDKKIDFSRLPFCLEASSDKNYDLLKTLAFFLSDKIYPISSKQRKTMHVAAVFANNFVNHLYTISEDICHSNAIPFEILHPLIKETADKISAISPSKVQTGPAIRNDQETIKNQMQLLTKEQQEIYQLLTNNILLSKTNK